MAQLGQRPESRRLGWLVALVAAASIVASFGTPRSAATCGE